MVTHFPKRVDRCHAHVAHLLHHLLGCNSSSDYCPESDSQFPHLEDYEASSLAQCKGQANLSLQGARYFSSEWWPWTRISTGRGEWGLAEDSGDWSESFWWGLPWRSQLPATPLLGAPASGALGPDFPGPWDLAATGSKSLEFWSHAITRVQWLEKRVQSIWKRLSFRKKVDYGLINLKLWVVHKDYKRRLTPRAVM